MNINIPASLAFLAAIPVIVALYLLRLKRRKLVVSSTFFWTETIRDIQANVPFQKLRWNILLFLQLLIALAVIFALTDPTIESLLNRGQRTIFIIDTSASMTAKDGGISRFDEAIGAVKSYCEKLSPREEVMVIGAGEHSETVLDFTGNLPAIERALDGLKTSYTLSDIATAYAVAQSKASETDKPKIVIIGDFSGYPEDLFKNPPYSLSYYPVGKAGRNVAITDFTVTSLNRTDEAEEISPFVVIRNYTDRDVNCDVEFYVDGNLADVRSISADAGSRESKIYRNVPYPAGDDDPGIVEARLIFNDDFDLDNKAYALAPKGDEMSVLLAGNDPFLMVALSGMPGIRLYQIDGDKYDPNSPYDLTIFPGTTPENLGAGNYVFFDPQNRDYLPCSVGEKIEHPSITDWDDGHPLLRFVNPGSFDVFSAQKLTLKPGAISLIDTDKTSIMAYGERNYLRALVFPFSVTDSDIITRPTFPVLLFNIVSFFRSFSASANFAIRTQGIGAIKVDALGEEATVTSSDGTEMKFPVDAGHVFPDVDKVGVYTLSMDGGDEKYSQAVVANFFDEEESDISAINIPQTSDSATSATRFVLQGEQRLRKWLLVIALIILCGEWFFHHRRGF
ncbi:MAG: BatA and WFA domain-containing protein [bacterium]